MPLAHGLQEREGGETTDQDRESGAPPKQERAPFVRGMIQEMGGWRLIPADPSHRKTNRG